ncbi:hypothetical protein GCM10017674_35050 [Streptomyces gardneri]|uniref:Protein kinase domain-containing protein n=1 Tax=Streptomyces gardneri TaxID=66892 RepID=A0A4Y3RFZ0_9ACTN|nr:hypothetical protein SGA01_19690 [Streptomyces gardneri]GHG99961.1 hypothetical protein GCM10017674_35050 [Streptomyces gardneri]
MLLLGLVAGALVLAELAWAVRIVPEGSVVVVERHGRHTRLLRPGLNVIFPPFDRIRNRIDLREQVVPFPPQPVITRDNLVVNIDTVIYYQVTDARAATYEVASYIQAIEQLIVTTLRNIVGGMDLDRTLASRHEINAALRGVLDEVTGKWGIRVNRVELKAIEPSTSIQDSMEKQMRADRDKRAAILTAEGIRHSQILAAEAEKQSAILRAQAEVEVARIHRQAEADDAQPPRPGLPSQALASLRPYAPLAAPFAHEPLREDDPRQVGRYRLTARLGEGGMGTVYLGMSPGARQVAVKVVREELVSDPSFRRRFAREVDAARRVSGFHTAPVVDAGPEDTRPWLVTEYIPGPSLHEVLGIHGPLSAPTLRALALGVAEALEAIHACGIVHRDLKPGNILVSAAGPRVIDFGIARGAEATALTESDVVVGTRGFLAPEQLTGAPLSSAVDMYAFGMVLCHAGGAARHAEGTSLAGAARLLPADLASVATACLDHDPAGRPSPTEVLRSIGGADTGTPSDWLPPALRTLVDLHQAATVTAAPPA